MGLIVIDKIKGVLSSVLDQFGKAWASEPAVILGIFGTTSVFAVEQFVGKGVFTADTGESLKNFVQALVPLLVSLVTRSQVTPTP